ncbi:FAD binding domain-containing protein [Arthrobacter jiangjiafuii]|uniref:FAD binding domain-containing protein n=1 Tax=Arthrobacter jiangjiafuii TaxID=2817475 RepID=A0A975M4X1_9MICC|nr:FAD binding domain-containing protein [Arthrobacter jiangjiafuii]MBP3042281.1 FAD binding domain-containing protein [Arthrobacter jiangjiafuii]QWC09957.1 FAD binding domain-containing protein [Arthrobacter jiangjiafuii]
MDLPTVSHLVHTADPGQWRPGDAWLAGGTVLFSYGSDTLERLLDITTAGWEPLTASAAGLEIAATCTIAELFAYPGAAPADLRTRWRALDLVALCCDSFVASFKVWNVSTVGGNICTGLPAGPMTALTASLDGIALIHSPDGSTRRLPVTELVTGDCRTALAPGELLRSVSVPAAALESRTAFRRQSLTNLGRSGALLIGRLDADGGFVLTVTAATKRPVQVRFASAPDAAELRAALDAAVEPGLWHDDVHGLPEWRRYMTGRLAEEIRAELAAPVPSPGFSPDGKDGVQ